MHESLGDSLIATKLRAIAEENPESDIAKLLVEAKTTRAKELGQSLEQLGKDWTNRRVRNISWGRSVEQLRKDWTGLEEEITSVQSDERLQLLIRLAQGMGLIVKRVDKDQIGYVSSLLGPLSQNPVRPFMEAICPSYSPGLGVSSIIFFNALIDLWDDPEHIARLQNHLLKPANQAQLTNKPDKSIQIDNVLGLINKFFDNPSQVRVSPTPTTH